MLVLSGGAAASIEAIRVKIAGMDLEASLVPEEGSGGSRFRLSVETSGWDRGEHPFTLDALSGGATAATVTGVAHVQPYLPPPGDEAAILAAVGDGRAAMWCELPDLNGGVVGAARPEVRGWAVAPAGIRRVLVTIDEERRLPALHGIPRSDLRWCFGDELAAESGFALPLDPEELPPGPHQLTVVAVAADGSAQGMSGSITVEPVEPRAPKPGRAGEIEPLPPRPRPTIPDLSQPDGDGGGRPRESVAASSARYGQYALAAALAGGRRVLDVGSGNGWGTELLARHATEAVGVDLSSVAVREAQRRRPDADLRTADPAELPFEDSGFDLVVCLGALEHVDDPTRALEEMRRVLRPGGVLALSAGDATGVPDGAPFAPRRLDREALRAELEARFANVDALRHHAHLATGFDDDADADREPERIELAATAACDGATLLLASDEALPAAPRSVVIDAAEVEDEQRWLTEMWRQRSVMAEVRLATLRTEAFYVSSAQRRTIERSAVEAYASDAETARLRREAERLAAENARILGSTSWRLTRPLRAAARRLRRRNRRR
jgi:SAM-dependent methyltransferase